MFHPFHPGVFADDGGAASGAEMLEQPEPDSTTDSSGGVASASLEQPHQPVRFKTPPRPTRVTVMPPTPPESGHGTPPQQVGRKVHVFQFAQLDILINND